MDTTLEGASKWFAGLSDAEQIRVLDRLFEKVRPRSPLDRLFEQLLDALHAAPGRATEAGN